LTKCENEIVLYLLLHSRIFFFQKPYFECLLCIMTHLIYACSSYAKICYLLNYPTLLPWHSDMAIGGAKYLLHTLSHVYRNVTGILFTKFSWYLYIFVWYLCSFLNFYCLTIIFNLTPFILDLWYWLMLVATILHDSCNFLYIT